MALQALQLVGVKGPEEAWRKQAGEDPLQATGVQDGVKADTGLLLASPLDGEGRLIELVELHKDAARFLQGRPGTAGLLDDIVDAWVEPIATYAIERGVPADTARADARLGIAVTRGLLLDLLATGDHKAVDAALERYITQYEAVQR